MIKKLTLLFAVTALSTLISAVFADNSIYRWTDKNGNTHFGSKPPENAKVEVIEPAYTKPAETKQSEDINQPAGEGSNETTTSEYSKQLKKLEKQRKDYCEKAKANKESMLKHHRVTLLDSNGQARMLSHEEKLEELRRTDKQINDYCKE